MESAQFFSLLSERMAGYPLALRDHIEQKSTVIDPFIPICITALNGNYRLYLTGYDAVARL